MLSEFVAKSLPAASRAFLIEHMEADVVIDHRPLERGMRQAGPRMALLDRELIRVVWSPGRSRFTRITDHGRAVLGHLLGMMADELIAKEESQHGLQNRTSRDPDSTTPRATRGALV